MTPVGRKVFNINNLIEIKILTRLRLEFSYLHGHKFRHGFDDTLNPLFPCSTEAENTTHYFLRCHFYNSNRAIVINNLNNILISFSTVSDNNLIVCFYIAMISSITRKIENY